MNEADYTAEINENVDALFDSMSTRISGEDMQRVRDAYALAAEAHAQQRRKSGEPYIIHPIAVARIVAEELELGANPVIAAFLHDVVEDTAYTIDDIRQRFGDDVAFLVGVVTKQKKSSYSKSKQVDNYQQILASAQFDIRAILIKIADRLHNMRTLDSMRPDKQMKIAGETDYLYAPLANRLGLYHMKTELENLSFRYRCPREYALYERLMREEEAEVRPSIGAFATKISELLDEKNIVVRTEIRHRMPCSIWRKMQSKKCDFNHVDGKHYIRIIYHAKSHQEEKEMSLRIYDVLSDNFKEKPGSVANYINAPKENGYQSFHVKLLSEQGRWEEVHISSERMVRNSRLGCAAERTEENVRTWLAKFNEILKDMAYHSQDIDYMDGVTASFYNDDILVFTPQGKGIILPKDATALDFAFEIHSQVGEHAVFARINGKLRSMKTVLQRGDCIEIGTDPKSTPDPDWTGHVLTYKAKRFLRNYFAHRPRIGYTLCPCCHPLPADEVIGFRAPGGQITLHKRNCPDAVRLASQEGDSIVAINFTPDPHFLFMVRIRVHAIDRYHLLIDLVHCITEGERLSIEQLHTETNDRLVNCTIDFFVHSVNEMISAIEAIKHIEGVDEVQRVDLKEIRMRMSNEQQ